MCPHNALPQDIRSGLRGGHFRYADKFGDFLLIHLNTSLRYSLTLIAKCAGASCYWNQIRTRSPKCFYCGTNQYRDMER